MMNNNEKEEERELFWVNIFRVDNEVIVAICDKELLGKELNDPGLGIRIKIDPKFYGGELLEFDEVLNLLREATMINAVGNNIVQKLIDAGFIDNKSHILLINGVKHVQIMILT